MVGRSMRARLVAVLLAFTFPASILSAETRGAMLYSSDSVYLNGKVAANTSAIFPGDNVRVPARSVASITAAGSTVLVPANSQITFNGDSISLEPQSAVSVSTSVGLAAEVGHLKITPASKSAKFDVGRYNGRVVVIAKQGSVTVAGLGANAVVPEGGNTSVPDPEPQKPGAIPATTGAGIGAIPAWVADLIGLAAVGAAAVVTFVTAGHVPASPVVP